jgi:hypothetical protein
MLYLALLCATILKFRIPLQLGISLLFGTSSRFDTLQMSFLSPTASSIFGGSGNEDGSLTTGHSGMLVNESCLDFLMMELVDAMCRTAIDEDTDREVIFYKLEMLGYRVGQSLVER